MAGVAGLEPATRADTGDAALVILDEPTAALRVATDKRSAAQRSDTPGLFVLSPLRSTVKLVRRVRVCLGSRI